MEKISYSEHERIVLSYFFSNTDKSIYCAKNTLSSQLWAFLMGQYSRSTLSLRERFLQLFQDNEKAYQEWRISEDEHITLEDLAQNILESKAINLDFFEEKATGFLKKWGVDYGHNSLKDADRIRFAIEGVSQVATKVLESPFPALGDFQEKSTRYLFFWKESLILPDELKASPYWEEIVELSDELIQTYLDFSPFVKTALEEEGLFDKSAFSSERVYMNTLNAKVFDIMRYLLPSSVSTSLWASFSTRTLEHHLSHMLSHPLQEIRTIAKAMHEEALTLSPGLLKHVWVSEYKELKRKKIGLLIDQVFPLEESKAFYQGITDKERVSLVHEGNIDNNVCASILFENARKQAPSYTQCLSKAERMKTEEKTALMEAYLWDRGAFDRMPRALQHSTISFEFLVDFWAYRDIQRHRATSQLWQWATAISGYDYPEYIDLPALAPFKEAYDRVMSKVTRLAQKVVLDNAYFSEYVCALGHLVRTSCEMHPGQLAYVLELRTTPQGHDSYRRLFLEVYRQLQDLAPLFSKYIRVGDLSTSASRKDQEEKSEAKRKAIGL